MTREEKNKAIDELSAQLVDNKNFYLTSKWTWFWK